MVTSCHKREGPRPSRRGEPMMPKKAIFDFEPAPRLEQVADKRPKQMEHGKHRGE
jgi:hypothetical protein